MPARKEITWTVSEDGCYNCTSHYINRDGYPLYTYNGKHSTVHRFLYEKHHGSLECWQVVRHKCDNRACVNVDHLEIGTVADNVGDMVKRKRNPRGSTHGRSKLTEDQVREIRADKTSTLMELASKYGVGKSTIGYIRQGKVWVDVK